MSTIKEKINPYTATITKVHIPEENTAFDGLLPAEDVDMVTAEGVGKFRGKLMVQIGIIKGKAPIGIIYRPGAEYQGYIQGRERYIDPESLKKGDLTIVSGRKGLWIPVDQLGTINSSLT